MYQFFLKSIIKIENYNLKIYIFNNNKKINYKMIRDIENIIHCYICQLKYNDIIKKLKNEIEDYEYEYRDEIHIPTFQSHYFWSRKK